MHKFAHLLFRRRAFFHDLVGVADKRRAVGPPQAAWAGLAIGRLEHASGDLRRYQRRAVEDVERERTGWDVGLELLEAVRTPGARRVDRLLADDVHDALLRGIGNALARKPQFLDLRRIVVAGNLEEPGLPIEEQSVPREGRDRWEGAGDRLGACPSRARALRLGRRGRRAFLRGRRGARQHQLRACLARSQDRAEKAAEQEGEGSIHRQGV